MGDILAQWVSVGDRFYQRTEVYGEAWAKQLSSFERFTSAPYGGPILVVHDNSEIHIHQVRSKFKFCESFIFPNKNGLFYFFFNASQLWLVAFFVVTIIATLS